MIVGGSERVIDVGRKRVGQRGKRLVEKGEEVKKGQKVVVVGDSYYWLGEPCDKKDDTK